MKVTNTGSDVTLFREVNGRMVSQSVPRDGTVEMTEPEFNAFNEQSPGRWVRQNASAPTADVNEVKRGVLPTK